jgi:hypothetical protein
VVLRISAAIIQIADEHSRLRFRRPVVPAHGHAPAALVVAVPWTRRPSAKTPTSGPSATILGHFYFGPILDPTNILARKFFLSV